MDQKDAVGLTVAMKQHFGLLPGQTLHDFSAELKKLTAEDKAAIKADLEKIGYVIKD
jgi:hypothetical protein